MSEIIETTDQLMGKCARLMNEATFALGQLHTQMKQEKFPKDVVARLDIINEQQLRMHTLFVSMKELVEAGVDAGTFVKAFSQKVSELQAKHVPPPAKPIAQLKQDDLFCPECGAKIVHTESANKRTRTSTCENGHKYPTFYVEQEYQRKAKANTAYKIE